MNAPLDAGGPYVLYHYFDNENRLLYIGISGDYATRRGVHNSTSRWMQLAASSTIKRYETREDLQKAEQAAIEVERPLFNVQYNDTPEGKERLRAYLAEIDRLDLLRPRRPARTSEPDPTPTEVQEDAWPGIAPAVSSLADGPLHIEVRHAPHSQVSLHVETVGLDTTARLNPDLALKVAEALTQHAWEAIWSQTLHRPETADA